MQLTKGAIGNLIAKYKSVLKKCHLLNVFGTLAVGGILVMGSAGIASAAVSEISINTTNITAKDGTATLSDGGITGVDNSGAASTIPFGSVSGLSLIHI